MIFDLRFSVSVLIVEQRVQSKVCIKSVDLQWVHHPVYESRRWLCVSVDSVLAVDTLIVCRPRGLQEAGTAGLHAPRQKTYRAFTRSSKHRAGSSRPIGTPPSGSYV